MRSLPAVLLLVAAPAYADDVCDHATAVASAKSTLLVAPRVFGTLGYVKQPGVDTGAADPVASTGPRVTAGLSYRIDGLFAGSATRAKASAECRRASALDHVTQAPARNALAARVAVLDSALGEAETMLRAAEASVAEHISTEPELLATRLRVDKLRKAAHQSRTELARMPATTPATLETFYAADAAVEREDARLRRLDAFDVTLRAGYDRFVDRDDDTPFFAMATLSINTGVLFQGGAQDRAARARSRIARRELASVTAQAAIDTGRATELQTLITDLEAQLAQLVRVSDRDARRFRDTLWFELVELRADLAFITAHAESVRTISRP